MLRNSVIVLTISLVTSLAAGTATAGAPAHPQYQWDRQPGQSLSLGAGEKTLLSCHFGAEGGFPYFHPVATPEGVPLTALAPPDHVWHRGIWFSWKYLNGVNYWDWAGRKNGVPDGLTQPDGKETVKIGPEGASLAMGLRYSSGDRSVLSERRKISIGVPRDDGSYTMDWRLVFTAAGEDVVFERTPPAKAPWGGYGGLSFRGAKSLKKQRVIDSEGRQGKQGHGKQARWVDFSARTDNKGSAAGVAMFDHPDNPRHPSPWYISVGKMPYFNAAFLFAEPYTLPAEKSFTLRYRVLVHPGMGDPAALEKEYESFAK